MSDIVQHLEKANQLKDDDLVCYCFKHTKKDIENDFLKNKKSVIYDEIAIQKKAGACNCASENPKGK